MMLRRVLRALTAAALAVPLALTGVTGTASAETPGRQLLFFNHGYGVLDRETADAIEHSAYMKEFANFSVRTTTGAGGQKWTGRYLMGRETYVELFGVGDLPGEDGKLGATGFGVSPEHAGDLKTVRQRLIDQGGKPVDFLQTIDWGDGKPVPWFDAIFTSAEKYESLNAWGMEYREEFLSDPRAKIGPPAYPGDVSRDRYLSEKYRDFLMRDVSAIHLAITARDLNVTLPLLKNGGFVVVPTPSGVLVTRGGTTMRLDAVPPAEIGLRSIDFTLNRPLGTRQEHRLGNSTLTVGPGARAFWTFQR
ncbi:DUF5829 family protein [Crossiella cryophila]|uniref:Uncharacterized protein n=1 Tax=Crossiella cryophila TaxID=43355 RepID=A0A7W7CDS8_9PSEU|nr:DUF5829 family protein [Crossiella cryophila]MBB4679275.1 hypothetical protein [Crossiella cryophila]